MQEKELVARPNGDLIDEIAQIMKVRARGERPMAYVHSYGCQQNVADGEKIEGFLEQMGFGFTQEPEDADFILFNTCAVREHAEDRVFGNVGALKNVKRRHPSVIVALCGCMMEQEHVAERIRKSYPFVNLVFGTHVIHRFPQLLLDVLVNGRRVFSRGDESEDKTIVEGLPIHREGRVKAWVTVMYGCNNFCSYCIVPYVRGRERSRAPEAILEEFQGLVQAGYKDITLLGQNVNSYGKNLESPTSFAQLLRDINQIDGIERIRFMTSHPKDLSDELIYAMRDCKKVCNYLHLPMQSGSSRLLNKMNRRYTKEQYLSLVDKIRHEIPDISLSTDIIVGFPGETEKDFEETIDVVKKCGFSSAFTFIYSKRPGTPAAAMDCQIDEETAHKRFNRLLDVLNTSIHNTQETKIGKTYNVLAEKESDKAGIITGRAEDNTLIHFNGGTDLIGNTIPVKITENKTFYLIGERI